MENAIDQFDRILQLLDLAIRHASTAKAMSMTGEDDDKIYGEIMNGTIMTNGAAEALETVRISMLGDTTDNKEKPKEESV